MLLKIIKRLENTHTLFSICADKWFHATDEGRRHLLHTHLVTNHLVPRNLPLTDLDLEGMRDRDGQLCWEVHRLNVTRSSFRIFIRVIVFSNRNTR